MPDEAKALTDADWVSLRPLVKALCERDENATHTIISAINDDGNVRLIEVAELLQRDSAVALIKNLHHKGGKESNRDDAIAFITQPIWMGLPKKISAMARGRKPKKTQYDLAYERRKGLHHRWVRLPENGLSGGLGKRRSTQNLREQILALADKLSPTTPRHKLTTEILRVMDGSAYFLQGSPETVRRVLRTRDINKRRN